jgi:hypothetical protein
MKAKLVLTTIAAVLGQSVLAADEKPLIADPIVEKAIRFSLKKPKGELTKADLEKVTKLFLFNKKITGAGLKEVAKCKKLTFLQVEDTKITLACVAQLKKALPKCRITHNAKHGGKTGEELKAEGK